MTLVDDFNYLISKINLGSSFLDGKAILILNGFSSRLKELEENQEDGLTNDTLIDDFNYFISKVNLKASFLDAKAIKILNNLPSRIKGVA